jgi:hypothetical protein
MPNPPYGEADGRSNNSSVPESPESSLKSHRKVIVIVVMHNLMATYLPASTVFLSFLPFKLDNQCEHCGVTCSIALRRYSTAIAAQSSLGYSPTASFSFCLRLMSTFHSPVRSSRRSRSSRHSAIDPHTVYSFGQELALQP